MGEAAVFYGKIIGGPDRDKLADKSAQCEMHLAWMERPALYEKPGMDSHVFIDLDDPRFTTPQFLLSLAAVGGTVEVLGASRNPDLDIAHFAKLGVREILTPEQCLEKLHQLLDKIERPRGAAEPQSTQFGVAAVVGVSSVMREIQKTVSALSEVDFPTALILGETGTGKSLLSKVLHNSGQRSAHNLVEVNCSAIPDELFESELFGHVKGAFTDAKTDKQGLFEFAEGGTLFLDEVADLSRSAQAKLLKVLEDKKLRRVGGVAETAVNVRVVAATNRMLEEVVEAGNFRQDLFYRLNLLCITIPPLREHLEDIPALAAHYLAYFGINYGKSGIRTAPRASALLKAYHWPGNIRQLCNVIERAVLLNKSGVIDRDDLGLAIEKDRLTVGDRRRISIDIPPQGISLREIEIEVVKQVLHYCGWNRSRAAEYLGISRPRLRRLLELANLEQNRRPE